MDKKLLGAPRTQSRDALQEMILSSFFSSFLPGQSEPGAPSATVKLNGNRRVTGVLRGFDQFMNVVLDEVVDAQTQENIGMVVRSNMPRPGPDTDTVPANCANCRRRACCGAYARAILENLENISTRCALRRSFGEIASACLSRRRGLCRHDTNRALPCAAGYSYDRCHLC